MLETQACWNTLEKNELDNQALNNQPILHSHSVHKQNITTFSPIYRRYVEAYSLSDPDWIVSKFSAKPSWLKSDPAPPKPIAGQFHVMSCQ